MTILKYWPVLILAAGVIATAARSEVELTYASERLGKLEARQMILSADLQKSIQILQLNVARICVKIEAGCRE